MRLDYGGTSMAKKKKRKEPEKKGTGYQIELIGVILIVVAIIGCIPGTGLVGNFVRNFAMFLVGPWYGILLLAVIAVGIYMIVKRDKPDFFTSKLIGLYIFRALFRALLQMKKLRFRAIRDYQFRKPR